MNDFLHEDKLAEAKPSNLTGVLEAAKTFKAGVTGGAREQLHLEEAFSTSDFPVLLGQALDIELLSTFKETPAEWTGVADTTTVNDFRPKKLRDLFGLADFDDVAEGEEYKGTTLDETEYEVKVGKTGRRVDLTWELRINRDFDALAKFPARFAQAARNTEDKKVFGALFKADGNGLNTTFFKGDAAPTKLPLTADNLETAYNALSLRTGYQGNLVDTARMILVVHPSQLIAAKRIVESERIERTTGDVKTVEANPFRGVITVVAPKALARYNQAATAATTWFLLPAPGSENPALVKASLRGYENPDIRQKNDTGVAVGGGQLSPDEGSFLDDTISYRGRHVVGAATVMPFAVYASTGA